MKRKGELKLLVVGASARAAALSARNAGSIAMAIDRFGDVDLATRCRHVLLPRFPNGLLDAAMRFPAAAWIYTGPLENHPGLISRLAARRRLYGNSAEVVRRVRDPFCLSSVLREVGLPCPALRSPTDPPTRGTWLRKPCRSGGGAGITVWRTRSRISAARQSEMPARLGRMVFQEFVPGPSIAAAFVAAGGESRLLGITRQLVGADWCGAAGFQYSGSIGPLVVSGQEQRDLVLAGRTLATRFHLEGLFGVDAIQHAGRVWPVEVNPRYCASVEILELARGCSYMRDHIDACRGEQLSRKLAGPAPRMHGKAIVYAARDFPAPRLIMPESASPSLADIPRPGTMMTQGQPVVTVFAEGQSPVEVEETLRLRVDAIRDRLRSDDLTLDLTSLESFQGSASQSAAACRAKPVA